MSRRLQAAALSGVALLLLVSTALPLAMADHSYSHRYVMWGRLVDANGDPVPGMTMDLGAELFNPEGACRGATGSDIGTDAYGPTVYDPVTDEHGDFVFCFHVHTLNRVEPGRGFIRIQEMPEFGPLEVQFNAFLREQFVLVQLPETHENADTTAVEGAYTVLGRLWREASGRSQSVENIEVFGDVLQQEPVQVRLLDPQGNVVGNATTTTNDYGDYAVRVPTQARFTEGTVEVTAADKTTTQPAAQAGVSALEFEYDPLPNNTLRNVLTIGGAIVVLGIVVGGGYYGIQRMTERREIEAARAKSTRKRAKR